MKQGLGGSGETESSVHEHGCAMARIAHFICGGPEGLDGAGLCINDLADGKTCFFYPVQKMQLVRQLQVTQAFLLLLPRLQ